MQDDLSDREKCIVVQMMLRQSPRLKGAVAQKIIPSLQTFYRDNAYPNLSPQDVNNINLELDKFFEYAETQLQKGLIASLGKDAFGKVLKTLGIGKKADDDEGISESTIKEMEDMMRKEVDRNDGT